MGPEHSSARLERFLQLCDDDENEFPVGVPALFLLGTDWGSLSYPGSHCPRFTSTHAYVGNEAPCTDAD